jgi:predicted enzyme related to lactoylglutathione lyase
MITLAGREPGEVEPGPGQHGHAAEAAPVCGHRQTGVTEPVQVPGDGSQGNPECAASSWAVAPSLDPSSSTGYITFDLGPGADLAVWSGQFEDLSPDVPRTSEVCLAIGDGGADEVNAIFKQWQSQGVTILREPHDAGFGLTFLAADPDGNRIRVAPRG